MPKSRKSIPEPEPSAICCEEWPKSVADLSTCAQDFARREPAQAVGLAFFTGLVLTVLPVGRLIGGIVRLAFGLIRPALVILGAVKLCEELEKRNNP